MSEMTFQQAIRETIRQEMAADPNLFLIGEDVGPYGGEMGTTKGLWDDFGDDRMRDAPIAESAIMGCAFGAAITGCRAIAEIPFGDFIGVCMDQILNQASKIRHMTGGQIAVPLVIRTTMGGYGRFAAQHSQCLESWFVHIPGIKVVVPSNAADAAGLLRSSLRDGNPVIFFEHKGLYPVSGEVPDVPEYTVPLGKASVVRAGTDVTVVATSLMVLYSIEAADKLARRGISVEIVDPRTLDPLDEDAILSSVAKTGHAVVVHEAVKTGGYGGEIASVIADRGFGYLKGPIKRVGARSIPIPFSPPLEDFVLPQVEDIVAAVEQALA